MSSNKVRPSGSLLVTPCSSMTASPRVTPELRLRQCQPPGAAVGARGCTRRAAARPKRSACMLRGCKVLVAYFS